ncbi:Hypothetical protein D9617_61g013150 [Elsinoe fawcettii]|nr:Hypothetical protein D9617_61g013150 [Elsinoe fawcettii]
MARQTQDTENTWLELHVLHLRSRDKSYHTGTAGFVDHRAQHEGCPESHAGAVDRHQALCRPTGPFQALARVKDRGIRVRARWMPAHTGIKGNEITDEISRQMTVPDKRSDTCVKGRLREAYLVVGLVDQDIQKRVPVEQRQYGKCTYKLDKALLGRHTRLLYDALSS